MPARLSWRTLGPGLAALVVIVAVTLAVLAYGGVGRVRGETIRVYVVTSQARGVMKGTEVWLAGQKVGAVDRVSFRPPGSDTAGRVVIAIDVRESDAQFVRRNAHVEVRAGGNILGPMVVYIDEGSPTSPAVAPGDTLRAFAQRDLEVAAAKLKAASVDLGPVMADARIVIGRMRDPNGTVGAFMMGDMGSRIAQLRANVEGLRARTAAVSPGDILANARGALSRVDSIRSLLRSTETTFGRFRRDSSLSATVAGVRDELVRLRTTLDQGDGTIARFSRDSALTRAVADAQREMTLLVEDISRRPLRYVWF